MHTKFYVCTHPEHNSIMEIFSREDFGEARRLDDGYRILVMTVDKGEALEFVQEAIRAALEIDPGLEHLKQDIQELYL